MRVRSATAAMFAVLAGCVALGVYGLGVEGKLDPLSLKIDGTGSARGEALAEAHFGDASQFAVLLSGPPAAIERQGPPLVRALRHSPKATVISPWDRGTVAALRPGPPQGADHRRLPRAAGDGDARHGPRTRRRPRRARAPAAAGDAVRLRLGLAGAAGRDRRRDRARRAARRPARSARPAARLPLSGRRRDPARLRRPHRARRPRRARPAQLGDDDRRDLARRLHDDGPGARGRLLAADRLPLPRGARRRARAARGGRDRSRAHRRAHDASSPARPCSRRSPSPPTSSPARSCSRSPSRSASRRSSASSSPSAPCPACSACSASASTPAPSAGAPPSVPRGPGWRGWRPGSCADRRPRRWRSRFRSRCSPRRRSALDHGGARDRRAVRPRTRPGKSAEAIDAAVGPGWEAPFVLVAAAPEGPITTPARLRAAEPLAAADRKPNPGSGR